MEVSSDTNIGGAGKCVLTFLKTYDRSKFDVSVVLPPNSLLKAEVEKYGVPVFEVEGMADKSLDRTAVKNLKQLFREQKPDIVHTHASMSARFAARSLKIGIVYTRHSVFPPSPKISRGIGKKINGFINNRTSDRIIAVAEAAKDGPYLSKDDFRQRTKASKTVIDYMAKMGLLGNLPESNQLSLFDFA